MSEREFAAYPWALRVTRFDDEGFEAGQRQRFEAELGRPLTNNDWGVWHPPRSQWGDGPWQTEPDLGNHAGHSSHENQ